MPRKRDKPKLQVIGYDGRVEIGFKPVQDPFEPDKELTVAVNIRHDEVEHMFARHQIDEAQRRAGNRFLGLVERAEEAHGLAVDPGREPVDSSGFARDISDARLAAAVELSRLAGYLGVRDYRIARFIIARKSEGFELKSQRDRDYLFRRFRDILTDLSIYWGYQSKPKVTA